MLKPIFSLALVVTASCVFAQAGTGAPPAPAPTPAVAQADDAAVVMGQVVDKMKAHTSVKGTLVITGSGEHVEVKFSMMKPNYVSVVSPEFEVHCAGGDTQFYSAKDKMLLTLRVDQMQAEGSPTAILIGMFGMLAADATGKSTYQASGKAKPGFFRGQKATVLTMNAGAMPIVLYVSADTLAPIAFTSPDGKNTGVYTDLVFDAPMKADEFAWTPPADAKLVPGGPPANGGGS